MKNNTLRKRLGRWHVITGIVLILVGLLWVSPYAWTVMAATIPDLEFTSTPVTTEMNTTPADAATPTVTAIPKSTAATTATPEIALEEDAILIPDDVDILITPTDAPTSKAETTAVLSEAWRLRIPSIDLETIIVGVGMELTEVSNGTATTWDVPDMFAAGWHTDSAEPGETGNMVLNGHNNVYGEVFRDLDKVQAGDLIYIEADGETHIYTITERHLLQDKWVSLEEQTANAQWVLPTEDERLTLVTCWPYTGNSHRLIVVAVPYEVEIGYEME